MSDTETSRADMLFNLRYAIRTHERYTRLMRRLDFAIRTMSIISISGAVWSIGAENRIVGIVLGLLFVVVQAVEFALRPNEIAAKSMEQRQYYANIWATDRSMSDNELLDAYCDVSAKDQVIIPELIRHLAYNDAAQERGCEEKHLYSFDGMQKILAGLL